MATTLTGGNPHIIQLPTTPSNSPSEPQAIAQQWLTDLQVQLARPESINLASLFHEESWWRDMLALDWDMRTIHTATEIEAFLRKRQGPSVLSNFRLQNKGQFKPSWNKVVDGLSWVSSMFFFETAVGSGSGMLRLTQSTEGRWKAYAIYTSLQELKGAEEPLGKRRPEGTTESMPGGLEGGTWIERRQRQQDFLDEDPTVLVIGAGKSYSTSRTFQAHRLRGRFENLLIQSIYRPSWSEYGSTIAKSRSFLSTY
jgi:hypothetical protein